MSKKVGKKEWREGKSRVGDSHTVTESHIQENRGITNGAHPQLFPVGSHQLLLCDSDVFTAAFPPIYSDAFKT